MICLVQARLSFIALTILNWSIAVIDDYYYSDKFWEIIHRLKPEKRKYGKNQY